MTKFTRKIIQESDAFLRKAINRNYFEKLFRFDNQLGRVIERLPGVHYFLERWAILDSLY